VAAPSPASTPAMPILAGAAAPQARPATGSTARKEPVKVAPACPAAAMGRPALEAFPSESHTTTRKPRTLTRRYKAKQTPVAIRADNASADELDSLPRLPPPKAGRRPLDATSEDELDVLPRRLKAVIGRPLPTRGGSLLRI
jgi:hypothetical protein